MDYDKLFEDQLNQLREEGNYRYFAHLERQAGSFPKVAHHRNGEVEEITVWCSNDYLGMGQNVNVLDAMHRALERAGAGSGGTRNI
ncbi:MAG TPA: 5-aminolevulinate synthase, partial [Alphaproteobacteria bacterium]|nr:5-aminolevulinate synthase [Alphaproteobacteria bacterium]